MSVSNENHKKLLPPAGFRDSGNTYNDTKHYILKKDDNKIKSSGPAYMESKGLVRTRLFYKSKHSNQKSTIDVNVQSQIPDSNKTNSNGLYVLKPKRVHINPESGNLISQVPEPDKRDSLKRVGNNKSFVNTISHGLLPKGDKLPIRYKLSNRTIDGHENHGYDPAHGPRFNSLTRLRDIPTTYGGFPINAHNATNELAMIPINSELDDKL